MFGQMPLTYLVKHLIIINVVMFFGTMLVLGQPAYGDVVNAEGFHRGWLALYMPGSPNFRPYQIATHMFMHGDISHLFFNMFSLYMFGPVIEMVWGAKRLFIYYVVCGLGAAFLQLVINYYSMQSAGDTLSTYYGSMWGASGAIFGLYAAYAVLFPNNQISLLFPPITLKAKYFVLIMGLLEIYSGVAGSTMSNIAHFAHVGGAIFGLLLIWYWGGFDNARRKHF
jgi:membrane associated rhomboid family serine protease